MSIIHVQELPRTMIHIIVEVIHDDGSVSFSYVDGSNFNACVTDAMYGLSLNELCRLWQQLSMPQRWR